MTRDDMSAAQSQGFSHSWLSLREPADHEARDKPLADELTLWSEHLETVNVLDLGAGTGSNLRYLAPLLGHNQNWILIDSDEQLLEELPRLLASWAEQQTYSIEQQDGNLLISGNSFTARVHREVVNLATSMHKLPFANTHLVTGSALLDLTSSQWLDELAHHCIENQCATLFALNYNGLISWKPAIDNDDYITQLLNEHQLGDKGFGSALGPYAAAYFADQLQQAGRDVQVKQSNWTIDSHTGDLQDALLEGWAQAAQEQNPESCTTVQNWQQARCKLIEDGQSELCVGHIDLLSIAVG